VACEWHSKLKLRRRVHDAAGAWTRHRNSFSTAAPLHQAPDEPPTHLSTKYQAIPFVLLITESLAPISQGEE
jgi:hypothetical protein